MKLRVLYLFAGPRRKIYEEYKQGKSLGIDLVGLDHLSDYGIEATFLENRLTEFLRRISFNLVQLPVLFRLWSCDLIFSGSGIFTLFLVKYVLRFKKPKWVIYNTYLTGLLKRNTRGFKSWVIRKAIFSADAIVSPSRAQSDFLRRIGLPETKNYYLPYGIDYKFFDKETEAGIAEISGPYIFSAGRDIGRDYKTLIEAVRDLPVKLLIAAKPRNLVGINEFPSNVTVSHFDQTQMPALLKNCEFVVTPVIAEEKMVGSDCSGQYALLRAMSCGKAVITSARATLVDYFTAGQHGLIVKPQNVAELQKAIMSLWNDSAKARALGAAGRQNIKDHFTIEIFSRNLAKIFHEVAGK